MTTIHPARTTVICFWFWPFFFSISLSFFLYRWFYQSTLNAIQSANEKGHLSTNHSMIQFRETQVEMVKSQIFNYENELKCEKVFSFGEHECKAGRISEAQS